MYLEFPLVPEVGVEAPVADATELALRRKRHRDAAAPVGDIAGLGRKTRRVGGEAPGAVEIHPVGALELATRIVGMIGFPAG